MKQDEAQFLIACADSQRREMADAIGARLGIDKNRVRYLLEKWAYNDWWDYGVSLRTGWVTSSGQLKANELRAEKG